MIPCFTTVFNVKSRKLSGKNWKGFQRNCYTNLDSDYWKSTCPNFRATPLLVNFSKAFDYIQKRKMEQILQAYGLSKETVTDIMILYKNMKTMVCSPDGDTEFFDIVIKVRISVQIFYRLVIVKTKSGGMKKSIVKKIKPFHKNNTINLILVGLFCKTTMIHFFLIQDLFL